MRPRAVASVEEEKLGRTEGESNLVEFLPDLAFSVEREARSFQPGKNNPL